MTTEQLLIAILRAVITETPFTEPLTFAQLKAVYKLAAKHDLSHFVHFAVQDGALPKPADDAERALLDKLQGLVELVQYRYVKLEAELAHISAVLEREQIPYMPLKGAVLRVLYPQPWMRTSCDVDVLVHEEDLDRAVKALVEEGFKTDGERHAHDVSLFCDGVHLELHYTVLERRPQTDEVLARVWEHTVSKGCRHIETPDFFAFHHIAHMACHFRNGGCGVRTVMDLWLLRESGRVDEEAVRGFCQQAGLLTFYEQMCRLAAIWFGDGERDGTLDRVEAFVIYGGAYGTRVQSTATSAVRHGGRFAMARHVLFMPYRDLKYVYPALDGKPWLTPFYQLRRLFSKVLTGHSKSAATRIIDTYRHTDEEIAAVGEILSAVGLHHTDEVEI